jgi:PAS domain S-box-containing protein
MQELVEDAGNGHMKKPYGLTWLGLVAGVTILQYLAVRLGLVMGIADGNVSPVWPATGFAIAVLLRFGVRLWPGVALGSFLGLVQTGVGTAVVIGEAAAALLEAVTAVWLVRRWIVADDPFSKTWDVIRFCILAGGAATAISATVGVTSLCLGGVAPWNSFEYLWGTWWLGDVMGALIVAPFLIVWTTSGAWKFDRRIWTKTGLVFVLLLLAGVVAFWGPFVSATGVSDYPIAFLTLPIVVSATFLAGRRGATAACVVCSTMAIAGTAQGVGPFFRGSVNESLLLLQSYLVVVSVTAIILAAVLNERDGALDTLRSSRGVLENRIAERTRELLAANAQLKQEVVEREQVEEELRESREMLSMALHGANLGTWHWDLTTGDALWTEHTFHILGYETNEIEPNLKNWKKMVHPEDWPTVAENLNFHMEGKLPTFDVEYRSQNKSGDWQWVQAQGNVIAVDAEGKPTRMAGVLADITVRRRAEEALQESEAKYRFLAEHASDLIWTVDLNMRTTFMSASVEKVLGFTPQERMVQDVEDQLTPETLELARRKLLEELQIEREQGIQEGKSLLIELDCLHKNGSVVCLQTVLKFIRDEDGTPIGLHGISRDITELKRSQQALRESQEKLQTLFETSPAGILLVNPEGRITFANRKTGDLFSRPCEDLAGTPYIDLVHPADRSISHAKMKALMAGEIDHVNLERRYKASDGREFRGHLSGRRLVRPDGGLDGLVGVITDITDRKKAEEALRQSEEKYRTVVEESFDGVFVHSGSVITFANSRLHEMLGYGPGELEGLDPWLICRSDYQDITRSRAQARIRRESVAPRYEVHLLRKDGTSFPAEINAKTVAFENEPGIQLWVRDLTEHKLLEKRLVEVQRMEAVGTLAGGIAHDFNNLLHIISGHAELLEMKSAGNDTRYAAIDAIRQATDRGADLVKQILTFSRRLEAKFESINLNENVIIAERLLYRTIPKMIQIDLQLEEGLLPVQADSTQIEQLLINIAVNAKDAMPDGGKLTIVTRNVFLDEGYCRSNTELAHGRYVLLKVSDTGHGMEEDVLQRVFEPFFTTKGLANGTGLGLATVFGIVKMHGGHITCESEIGKGTNFEIYFPAAEEAKPDIEQKQEISAVAGGTEKILVVDDEPLIRDLAKRILEKAGYSVVTARSGKEGIEIYTQHSSDIALVILDLIMPEMGGKQCLLELLKITPRVKALIASGFAIEGDTKAFVDDKAKGMVIKPFNMKELLRHVRHVLDEA